jgi:peptidoglycan hydrolase-like protein with peptidoglycan-binding domain
VRAPKADVTQHWLLVKPGAPLRLHFARPVSAIRLNGSGRPSVRLLPSPTRTVTLPGLAAAGTLGVSAVGRQWERFPEPDRVTWFRAGGGPEVLATPAPGTSLGVATPLTLEFSRPVSAVFHGKTPWIGHIPGSWRATDTHTLVFTPTGFGFGVDTQVKLRLPAAVEQVGSPRGPTRLMAWTTPTGSQLRLQQILSRLGYLPLRWQPKAGDAAPTLAAQVQAAASPPAGSFTWKYANTPSSLVGLWHAGQENVVTRGAIMAFESDHDLLTDGYAGRTVWQALIAAALAGQHSKYGGYSYVIVHRDQRPQSLVVWHDGQTVLQTPANTGIPQAPTVFGTFPVYARFTVTTMRGTNPDGSKYVDPGIPWVSYFNGGDAIHGFTRASYGSPQSLGCVELPASEAARVFPYTPLGTLVTVTS